MQKDKIVYWVSTGALCTLFFASALMYILNYPRTEGFFISLGFPTWLIYPLAALKCMGALTILTKWSKFLKELAYAGFLFNTILALTSHLIVHDGAYMPAVIALILLTVSWGYDRKPFLNHSTL